MWRFDGAFSTSAANSSSNQLFCVSKSANRRVNVFQMPRLKVKIFSTLSARRGAHRSSMSHSAKAANRIKQEPRGSQSDQAEGGLSFRFSRREPHISGI